MGDWGGGLGKVVGELDWSLGEGGMGEGMLGEVRWEKVGRDGRLGKVDRGRWIWGFR